MTEESQAELELDEKIIAHCKTIPKGVPEKALTEYLNVEKSVVATAINRLLKKNQIDIYKAKQNQGIIVRWKDNEGPKITGDAEKKLIYQIVKAAGNKGIWIRDIRNKSNLPSQILVTKILKLLETERAIKSVKSVEASKRKVYMVYDMDPHSSLTGGAWYSNQDFDQQFVEVLNQQCYMYLNSKLDEAKKIDKSPLVQRQLASASSEDVRKYIMGLGFCKVELTAQDIEVILNTLVYDGKVEKVVQMGKVGQSSGDTFNTYLSMESLVQSVGLLQIPCGLCPVIDKCSENGDISPSTCVYMKEWLQY